MSATRAPVLACLSASLILLSTPLALAEPSTDEASRPVDASADTTPAQTADVGAPAEPPKAEQPKPRERKGIEEITVTARRTEENIQATPVTVTAFDAEDLEENDIRSLEDIQNFVPNLQFDQAAGSSNASRIYLRGVGNGDTIITDDNGVGIYVDSVFLPRAAGTLLTVSDVERVEVLAGPQGTLYGKNTIGGLVNYITKKPQWEYEARGSVRVGTYGTFDTGGMFNVPIVDERAALRVSFATRSNDGYQKNGFRDQDTQDTRSLNGRVQLRLQPADSLEVLFSGAQSISREHGYTPKCKLNDNASLNIPANTGSLTNRLFPDFGKECFDDEQRRDVRRVARDGQLEDHLKTINTYMQVNWSPAEWLTIKSNTAWNRNDSSSSGDGDATQLPVRNGLPSDFDKGEQDSVAQELNMSGEFDVGARKVKWISGVFGLVEDNFDKLFTTSLPTTVTEAGGTPRQFDRVIAPIATNDQNRPIETIVPTGTIQAALTANPDVLMVSNGFGGCLDTPVPLEVSPGVQARNLSVPGLRAGDLIFTCRREFEGVQTKARLRSNVLSYAAFSSFDVELTDSLKLAAGVRYTHERRRVSRFRQVNENDRMRLVTPAPRANPLFPGVNRVAANLRTDGITTDFERSIRIGVWTPSISLTYLVNDDLTFFISTARGFKSGGFNGRVEGDGNERVEYEPEYLTNYEVGMKSQWFDNRLIVNATYFQSRYKDIQLPNVQITNGARGALVVDNAGLASINGLDLQLNWRPSFIDGLSLRGTLGITNARYKEFDGGNKDDRLIGTPTYTGNLTASYRMDLGRFGELTSRLSWNHQGQKASESADFRSTHVDKYGTMGAGLTLSLPDGKTSLALNGSNLTNRTYFLTGIFAGDTTLRYFAPPRTFSLEVRRTF